jgi:predicted nucleotidyltransferase
MVLRDRLSTHRDKILAIASRYGARNVHVFGSVARGEDTPASDLDLLVKLDSNVTLLQHAALIRELETLLGCSVDVVSEGAVPQEVRQQLQAIPM